ncbi:hypothetical protein BDW74DRAFT_180271 [Aspergillus multicolor]|uniref:uncharacterized protein n=1 Tax=Aspergillus multicolor TaxID=41759 RepID=UPI003CCE009B
MGRDYGRVPTGEPTFACIICGGIIPPYNAKALSGRADWINKRKKDTSLIVRSTEVEELGFPKDHRAGWLCFWRAIIDDPETNNLTISGICNGARIGCYPEPVPTDPNRARIYGNVRNKSRWNTFFHMANLFKTDEHREAGRTVGYPVHAHCWLLVDRMIGTPRVQQNLRAFVDAVKWFWRQNKQEWAIWPSHSAGTAGEGCFELEQGYPWGIRECACRSVLEAWCGTMPKGSRRRSRRAVDYRTEHQSGSPLRVPDLQELMVRVTCVDRAGSSLDEVQRSMRSSPLPSLPTDIALLIVDEVLRGRPPCKGQLDDTRNLLEALHWELPRSYWIGRCGPELAFEVEDLCALGQRVDWAGFYLGLAELKLDPHWFCNSGLNYRRRILKSLGAIREKFTKNLDKQSHD